ncbi:MAG TPA: cytochrome C oxidase subunit IV family protein [Verrucomicrobiae bacterium]|nr:cytochrome C oxidase subunit IV family protein [Verrucomicrobiae bacterium]
MDPRILFTGVWLLLLLLLFTMFGIAHFNTGAAGTAVIVALAVGQMFLVMLFFMRMRESAKIVRLAAAAGFFWLLILFSLALSDYLTRQWH